jgi:hypothetical protein
MSDPDAPRPSTGAEGQAIAGDANGPDRSAHLCREVPYGVNIAMDTAAEQDRAYFESNPDETEYVRLAIPGELPGIDCGWVQVVQFTPGVRARAPWTPPQRGGAL